MSWALNAKVVGENGGPGEKVEKPEKPVVRCVQIASAENVRFFTGVQRVTTPIWAVAKSGLQV